MEHMAQLGVESRPTWKPMHLQSALSAFDVVGGAASERIFERGLCIPSGSRLTDDQVERVVHALVGTRRGLRRPVTLSD